MISTAGRTFCLFWIFGTSLVNSFSYSDFHNIINNSQYHDFHCSQQQSKTIKQKQLQIYRNLSLCAKSSKKRALYENESDFDPSNIEKDIIMMEREVIDSTRARLDLNKVQKAILEPSKNEISSDRNIVYENGWAIPLTSASVISFASNFFLFHSLTATAIVFVLVFIAALGDPMEDDGIAGALARVVGRMTINSIQKSEPKVKSVLRATIKGDNELYELRSLVAELEQENEELRLWKKQRLYADEKLSEYTVERLTKLAKYAGYSRSETRIKSRLLFKLIQDGIIKMES